MPLLTMKQIMADSVKKATSNVDPSERYAVGAFNFSTLEEMLGLVEGARDVLNTITVHLNLSLRRQRVYPNCTRKFQSACIWTMQRILSRSNRLL